jgi:hypothetical protein
MLRLILDNPHSGWAYARLTDADKEVVLTGSYSPNDAICELVEAVERLETSPSTECCWSQGPGELHWNLRRQGSDLEIEILQFDGGFRQHWREPECIFNGRTKWLTFARQLLSSLESIRVSLGSDGYEREWRSPFPSRELERLRATIQKV